MDERTRAEFSALGVDLVETDEDEDVFEVWDSNAASFGAFARLGTQWHYLVLPGMEGTRMIRTGLDYCAVDVVLRSADLGDGAFDDIQVMETAALEAFAEANA